jgi:hypothetical protein
VPLWISHVQYGQDGRNATIDKVPLKILELLLGMLSKSTTDRADAVSGLVSWKQHIAAHVDIVLCLVQICLNRSFASSFDPCAGLSLLTVILDLSEQMTPVQDAVLACLPTSTDLWRLVTAQIPNRYAVVVSVYALYLFRRAIPEYQFSIRGVVSAITQMATRLSSESDVRHFSLRFCSACNALSDLLRLEELVCDIVTELRTSKAFECINKGIVRPREEAPVDFTRGIDCAVMALLLQAASAWFDVCCTSPGGDTEAVSDEWLCLPFLTRVLVHECSRLFAGPGVIGGPPSTDGHERHLLAQAHMIMQVIAQFAKRNPHAFCPIHPDIVSAILRCGPYMPFVTGQALCACVSASSTQRSSPFPSIVTARIRDAFTSILSLRPSNRYEEAVQDDVRASMDAIDI